jgi:hypothetical protein
LVEDPGILLAQIQETLADIVKVAWWNFIALMCRLEGIDVFMPLLKFLLALELANLMALIVFLVSLPCNLLVYDYVFLLASSNKSYSWMLQCRNYAWRRSYML